MPLFTNEAYAEVYAVDAIIILLSEIISCYQHQSCGIPYHLKKKKKKTIIQPEPFLKHTLKIYFLNNK